ncbi:MAG: hypothetical protein AAF747_10340 [Planctomycetota bacterium]
MTIVLLAVWCVATLGMGIVVSRYDRKVRSDVGELVFGYELTLAELREAEVFRLDDGAWTTEPPEQFDDDVQRVNVDVRWWEEQSGFFLKTMRERGLALFASVVTEDGREPATREDAIAAALVVMPEDAGETSWRRQPSIEHAAAGGRWGERGDSNDLFYKLEERVSLGAEIVNWAWIVLSGSVVLSVVAGGSKCLGIVSGVERAHQAKA